MQDPFQLYIFGSEQPGYTEPCAEPCLSAGISLPEVNPPSPFAVTSAVAAIPLRVAYPAPEYSIAPEQELHGSVLLNWLGAQLPSSSIGESGLETENRSSKSSEPLPPSGRQADTKSVPSKVKRRRRVSVQSMERVPGHNRYGRKGTI